MNTFNFTDGELKYYTDWVSAAFEIAELNGLDTAEGLSDLLHKLHSKKDTMITQCDDKTCKLGWCGVHGDEE